MQFTVENVSIIKKFNFFPYLYKTLFGVSRIIEKIMACRGTLRESIQICIDIAFHLCASNKLSTPGNYREAFVLLAQFQIIPNDLADKMQKWTGLRNVISHLYDAIDDSKILTIVTTELDDFNSFITFLQGLQEI